GDRPANFPKPSTQEPLPDNNRPRQPEAGAGGAANRAATYFPVVWKHGPRASSEVAGCARLRGLWHRRAAKTAPKQPGRDQEPTGPGEPISQQGIQTAAPVEW